MPTFTCGEFFSHNLSLKEGVQPEMSWDPRKFSAIQYIIHISLVHLTPRHLLCLCISKSWATRLLNANSNLNGVPCIWIQTFYKAALTFISGLAIRQKLPEAKIAYVLYD